MKKNIKYNHFFLDDFFLPKPALRIKPSIFYKYGVYYTIGDNPVFDIKLLYTLLSRND